jgi:hypothetical protein
MDAIDMEPQPQTADEQLGSPGFSFELGWLAGVVLGALAIATVVRRRARRDRDAIADT